MKIKSRFDSTGAYKVTTSASGVETVIRTRLVGGRLKVTETSTPKLLTLRNATLEERWRSPKRQTHFDKKRQWRPPTDYNSTIIVRSTAKGQIVYTSGDPRLGGLKNGDELVIDGKDFYLYDKKAKDGKGAFFAADLGSTFVIRMYKGNFGSVGGTYLPFSIPEVSTGSNRYPNVSNNMKARADTECLLKVQKGIVNYGEAIAEARKTLRHLSKTAITLAKALRYARRGKWRQVQKTLDLKKSQVKSGKSPANRWLEYQYGWTPLVADIHGTFELLQEQIRTREMIFSAVRTVQDGNYSCRTKLYYKIRDEELAFINQMGLLNPLTVAWNLVPFSFVFDWLMPVSSFLDAFTATLGAEFVSGTRSTRTVFDHYVVNKGPFPTAGDGTITGTVSGIALRRAKLSSFPTPALYVKNPLSVTHAISAVALLRSLKS
ncbi:MAG: putative maturation protein [Etongtovirus faecivicinum]|uniref:Maturation protein n=1 Tax=Leviviridae sp. TaxID=2027243 RepID=A0ABY3SUG7_9VIRU|nr:MAG: putative maturation protein [Leviviridae sp.]